MIYVLSFFYDYNRWLRNTTYCPPVYVCINEDTVVTAIRRFAQSPYSPRLSRPPAHVQFILWMRSIQAARPSIGNRGFFRTPRFFHLPCSGCYLTIGDFSLMTDKKHTSDSSTRQMRLQRRKLPKTPRPKGRL